jgi:hypothetical protein
MDRLVPCEEESLETASDNHDEISLTPALYRVVSGRT